MMMSEADGIESSIVWNDSFKVGYGPMDDGHQELVDLLGTLQQARDTDLAALLLTLQKHLQSHFDFENGLMVTSKFPPSDCHIEEHTAVLRSVAEVIDCATEGNFTMGRRLVSALVDWFPAHADYLDSALAHWLVSHQMGGKPIVLRRKQPLG